RHMVMDWGMSKKIGPVSFKTGEDDPFLGREIQQQRNFSEHTMEIIDEEVSHIIEEAMLRAKDLLNQHRGLLDQLTKQLVEREELDNDEIRKILGPSAQETRPDWVAAFDIAQTPNSETNGSVSESNLPETETHPPG
ncbi:MAG: cell division protein FtsH, partial [Planctomycetota bacterium]|nr:cell division protein FtsH [Planctomycetota bacterium]